MPRATKNICDVKMGRTVADRNAVIAGTDDGVSNGDIWGMLDVNSIGVGTVARGNDGEIGGFNVGRSFKSNVHLWAVLKG